MFNLIVIDDEINIREGIRDFIKGKYPDINVAGGLSDGFGAYNGWVNSSGHRSNLLSETECLGVGMAYNENSSYRYYYTQNFLTEY